MSDLVVRQTGELVTDFGMQAVVSVDQAINRIKELQRFVQAVMVKGEDYGIIKGTSKPTLLKPGAEKLCEMYGLTPTLSVTDSEKDWANGFIYYESKCTLVSKRTGQIVAEGVGSCNNRETRYVNRDVYTLANTILKMAKKRALVDATLSATRSSGLFTQDIEDLGDLAQGDDHPPANHPQKQEDHSEHGDQPLATPPQVRAMYAIGRNKLLLDEAQIEEYIVRMYGAKPSELTKQQASRCIDMLTNGQNAQQMPINNGRGEQ